MHFYCIVVMMFADIVAVIIDDIGDDCFLMTILWLFNLGLYAVFSFSPAPPAASEAEAVCRVEAQYVSAAQQGRTQTADLSRKKAGGGALHVRLLESDQAARRVKASGRRLCSQRFSRIPPLSILWHPRPPLCLSHNTHPAVLMGLTHTGALCLTLGALSYT